MLLFLSLLSAFWKLSLKRLLWNFVLKIVLCNFVLKCCLTFWCLCLVRQIIWEDLQQQQQKRAMSLFSNRKLCKIILTLPFNLRAGKPHEGRRNHGGNPGLTHRWVSSLPSITFFICVFHHTLSFSHSPLTLSPLKALLKINVNTLVSVNGHKFFFVGENQGDLVQFTPTTSGKKQNSPDLSA